LAAQRILENKRHIDQAAVAKQAWANLAIDAIRSGGMQRIAVIFVEWAAANMQRVVIDWTLLDGDAAADRLAATIDRAPRLLFSGGTSISGAIDFAVGLFPLSPFHAERQVIDISGDGANNRGALQPQQAAELAKSRGVPIYTIGAGKEGYVPIPVYDDNNRKMGYRRMLSDVDEPALREIANTTGGKFFRVADTDTIESAFRAIDRAQKIEFQAKSYLVTTELFWWVAAPGLGLLLVGALLARPFWRMNVPAPQLAGTT
jgi:thiamine pyrophosphate-dependent acetolactate synthase large subunit-like protein